jgi:hypothetical protein
MHSEDVVVEVWLAEELLWLRHRDGLGSQIKGSVCHWKLLPEDWRRQLIEKTECVP